MYRKLAMALAISMASCQGVWSAEPLRFAASSAWAMPYARFDADRLTGGILFDLAKALEKQLSLPVAVIVLPRKRIDGAVIAGEIDLRCYSNPQWTAIPDQHVWSKSLFDMVEVIFGGANVPEPANLGALQKGAAISTVLGYEYQQLDPLFANGLLKRDDGIELEKVMLKLTVGRTPYGISEALALQWYVRTTPKHQLASWRLPVSRNDFLCGVPKQGRVPAPRILNALDDLKKSGKIDEILRNYR
jgi:polar amino acid transport system substrate-binding protein